MEGCRSGLTERSGKSCPFNRTRGFESHPFRQLTDLAFELKFDIIKQRAIKYLILKIPACIGR